MSMIKKIMIMMIAITFSMMFTESFALTTSKNITININNQTHDMGNSQYAITAGGVTTCTPDHGDSLPGHLKVSCNDPIFEKGDSVTINFEKYDYSDKYIWLYNIDLSKVKNGGTVICYLVGKELDVKIRCSAYEKEF